MNDTYNTQFKVHNGAYVSVTTFAGWTVVNTTNLPDNLLCDAVDFLKDLSGKEAGCGYVIFADADQTCFTGVASGHGVWLKNSLARIMRLHVPGYTATKPHAVVYCPTNTKGGATRYPCTTVYKKRGGFQTYANWYDELANVLSHEMRHMSQYVMMRASGMFRKEWAKRNCRSGSLEVDAEYYAAKYTPAFRKEFGIPAPTTAGAIWTRGAVRLTAAEKAAIVSQIGR